MEIQISAGDASSGYDGEEDCSPVEDRPMLISARTTPRRRTSTVAYDFNGKIISYILHRCLSNDRMVSLAAIRTLKDVLPDYFEETECGKALSQIENAEKPDVHALLLQARQLVN